MGGSVGSMGGSVGSMTTGGSSSPSPGLTSMLPGTSSAAAMNSPPSTSRAKSSANNTRVFFIWAPSLCYCFRFSCTSLTISAISSPESRLPSTTAGMLYSGSQSRGRPARRTAPLLELPNLFLYIPLQSLNGHPLLGHAVPLPDGDAVVGGLFAVPYGLKVDGDAKRRAYLVLAAVALADGAGLVEVGHRVLTKLVVDLKGLGRKLL